MTTKYFLMIITLLSMALTACLATPGNPTASPTVVEEKAPVSSSYLPATALSTASTTPITIPTASGVPTLYAVLVADTRDQLIGKSTQVDLDNLKILVENISKNTQLPNRQLIIQGDQMSRQAVVNVLTQLPATNQDLVIFYYSGHGTRGRLSEQRESKWPYLCVDGIIRCLEPANRLDLDNVVDTLKQKGPRFFIAIADACNDLIPEGKNKNWEMINRGKPDNYRTLFLEPSGYHIIASGSKAGQVSVGDEDKGGNFTRQFLDNLYQELASDYRPDWDLIMRSATVAIPYRDIRDGQDKIQRPQFDLLHHEVVALPLPTPIPPRPDPLPLPNPDPVPPPVGEIRLEILPSNRLRPGDAVQFAITASRNGYLFIFDAEHNSGGLLYQVFPNPLYQERSGKQHFQLSANQRFLWPADYFELNTKISAPPELGPRSLVALLMTDDQALNQVQELVGKPVNTLTGWLTQRLRKDQWVMTMMNYEIVQ